MPGPPPPPKSPDALDGLVRVFLRAAETAIRRASPDAPGDARFGAVLFVHRFGDSLNSHVHFHVIVTDGVFSVDPDDQEKAVFHPALDLDDATIRTVRDQLRHRGLRGSRRRRGRGRDGHFLFLMWTNDAEALIEHGGVYVGSIDGSSEPRRIVSDASSVNYTSSGHLLVMQESNLVAIPFDVDKLEVSGEAFVVADGVLMNRNNGHAAFSASENGTLVFARGLDSIPNSSYVWADRTGELSDTPLEPGAIFSYLRLSPDATRAATRAATTIPGPTGDPEVWVLDLVRGVRTRLTPSAPWTFDRPIWSPDGKRVLYVSAERGTWDLYTRNADASGKEELFLQSEFDKVADDWVGDSILYWSEDLGAAGSVFRIHDVATGESTVIFEKAATPRLRFLPDGDFIVYDSVEGGRDEVIIHQIDGGARWQVSTNGGRMPHWRGDGREIVYLDLHLRVMAVDVTIGEGGLTLGQPVELFQIVQNVIAWDVTGDHSRFLLATRPKLASEPLHVIPNWDAR